MPAMIDASCPKCGRRYGWCGKMTDQPPCPRCGHTPDPAKLAAAEAEMDAFAELLRTRPDRSVCQRQRGAAGLTLRQAASRLGVTPSLLSDVENGRTEMSAELAEKMGRLYDCGPGDESTPPRSDK